MRMIYKFIVCMFIVGFALPGSAQNQGKKFTLNDFCLNYTFRTQGITGLRSLNDGEHYTVLEDRGKSLSCTVIKPERLSRLFSI